MSSAPSAHLRSFPIRGGLLLLALVLPARLAWQGRDAPFLGHFHDDGLYWVSAKSLADGSGYRVVSLPEEPPQTKYPPLYPALLSLVWKLNPRFPDNVPLALLFSWLALPLYLLLTGALLVSLGMGRIRASVVCLILAAHPRVGFFSANLMADLLFCALISGALWMIERGERPLAGGLLAGAAFLTKVAALPLLLTAPLCYFLRKRRAQAGLFAAGMLPAVLGWTLWSLRWAPASTEPGLLYYTSYWGYYRATVSWEQLPAMIAENAADLLSSISSLVVPGSAAILPEPVVWLLALAFVGAAIRWAWRAGGIQCLAFSGGYAVQILLWNFPANERFALPLYPLLLGAAVEGCLAVCKQISRFLGSPVVLRRLAAVLLSLALAALAVVAIGGLWLSYRQLPGEYERRRQVLADHRKAYEWVSRNSPPAAAFIAFEDPMLYVYTGRRAWHRPTSAMTFYRRTDRRTILESFASVSGIIPPGKFQYLFLSPVDYREELLNSERVWLRRRIENELASREVFRSGDVRVYELDGGRAGIPK